MKNWGWILILVIGASSSCKDDSPRCLVEVQIFHYVGIGVPPNSLSASGSNGLRPFTYNWSTGSTDFYTAIDSAITIYSVTVTDADGCVGVGSFDLRDCPKSLFSNSYTKPAKINGRCWMDANVFDSISVPQIIDPNEWANYTGPAWCYYQNAKGYNYQYGKLFNWHAVISGKICPQGYHIPSNQEWQELIDFLGGNSKAGKEMKDSHLWEDPFIGVQTSAFDAQPAGLRDDQGQFMKINKEAYYWTSTEASPQSDSAFAKSLIHSSPMVFPKTLKKSSGLSCKCIAN